MDFPSDAICVIGFWDFMRRTGWHAPPMHSPPRQSCPQAPQLSGSMGDPHAPVLVVLVVSPVLVVLVLVAGLPPALDEELCAAVLVVAAPPSPASFRPESPERIWHATSDEHAPAKSASAGGPLMTGT